MGNGVILLYVPQCSHIKPDSVALLPWINPFKDHPQFQNVLSAKQPSQESFVAFSCPVPFISYSLLNYNYKGDSEFTRHLPDICLGGAQPPAWACQQGDGPDI